MSIATEIASLEAGNKLMRYVPLGGRQPSRRLYLTEGAVKDLSDPNSATNLLVGRGVIEAALARWCLKGRVIGNTKRGTFIDRLCSPPAEIWEVRVTEANVQARLFGRFGEPDTLILSAFHTRGLLGDRGSAGWQDAMARCEATWKSLFPNHAPFSGATIKDYVTENCDEFPLCP